MSHNISLKQQDHRIIIENEYLTLITHPKSARIEKLYVVDKKGKKENVVLSYDDEVHWIADEFCFGATVGPVAGRIASGEYRNYQLEKNDGKNTLHSGSFGYHKQKFLLEKMDCTDYYAFVTYKADTSIYLGLPQVKTMVTCYVNNNQLSIIFHGQPLETTIWNPTNHTYFNLSGKGQNIHSHILQLNARGQLELNEEKIPTGEVLPLNPIFKKSSFAEILNHYPNGLDDCFLLNKDLSVPSLILFEEESGRKLEITTNREAVVLFTGTGMTSNHLVNGVPLLSEQGLAIECQEVPDAHHNLLSNIEYSKEESLYKWTNYQFSI